MLLMCGYTLLASPTRLTNKVEPLWLVGLRGKDLTETRPDELRFGRWQSVIETEASDVQCRHAQCTDHDGRT